MIRRGLVLALLCLAIVETNAEESDRRMVVGVLPFQTPEKYPAFGSLAAAKVRSELLASPRYQLVEEERIAEVMAKIAASHRLDYSQRDAIEVGRLVAARYIAFGEVISIQLNPPGSLFDCDVSAALRLVHVETGVVAFQKITTIHGGKPESCLDQAVAELTCEMLKSASLAGLVVDTPSRQRVVIDLGSRDGIRARQRLQVVREGGILIHPVSGKELRRPDLACGVIEIETVGKDTSIAKAADSKEADIRPGDRVLLPFTTNCSKLGSLLQQAGTPIFKALIRGIK